MLQTQIAIAADSAAIELDNLAAQPLPFDDQWIVECAFRSHAEIFGELSARRIRRQVEPLGPAGMKAFADVCAYTEPATFDIIIAATRERALKRQFIDAVSKGMLTPFRIDQSISTRERVIRHAEQWRKSGIWMPAADAGILTGVLSPLAMILAGVFDPSIVAGVMLAIDEDEEAYVLRALQTSNCESFLIARATAERLRLTTEFTQRVARGEVRRPRPAPSISKEQAIANLWSEIFLAGTY